MKKIYIILIILFLLIDVAVVGFVLHKKFVKPEEVHFHAGFQVYVDGKLQDFSDSKYMEVKPCTTHEDEPRSPEEEQMDKAHLHDNVGNVAHSHVNGGVWKDLFINIKYSIPKEKKIEGYVNGKPVDNIMRYPLKPYDSVVIIIGSKPEDINIYLKNAVKRGAIEKEEKKSESCGTS